MKNSPGYPLPDGELGEDEIVCQLVFLPNRPEYWQAFVSSLHYLATWKAWERDGDKRGQDAASDWRVANELTMECWRMTCLQELQDDVAAILAIMQLPQSCCDPGDVTDGDRYTDRVEDGEGDVPQPIIDAGYAEDAADWDGFDDYKCMIAHVTINQLIARLNEIAPLVDTSGAILGGVTALAGIIAVIVGTGGLAIVFGIVAGIGATSLLYQALTDFDWVDGLADKVVDNFDKLACSIYFGDGDVAALSNLNNKIDELFTVPEALILKNMNLGPTLKSLYAGRYDQQDIADILLSAGYELDQFSCECEEQIGEFLISWGWEDGWRQWQHNDWILQDWSNRGGGWGCGDAYPPSDFWQTTNTLRWEAGLATEVGDKVWINRVTFWYKQSHETSGDIRLYCAHDGGFINTVFPNSLVWAYASRTFSPPLESTAILNHTVRLIENDMTGNACYIDDVTIDYDCDNP